MAFVPKALAALGRFFTSGSAVRTAGAVVSTVSAARGVKSLLSSDSGGPSAPAKAATAPTPQAPQQADAQKKAATEVARRRRISLLTGGKTNITGGQAIVPEANIGRKSLIGQ